MNPFVALILGGVMGGVLASGGEPPKKAPGSDAAGVRDEKLDRDSAETEGDDL